MVRRSAMCSMRRRRSPWPFSTSKRGDTSLELERRETLSMKNVVAGAIAGTPSDQKPDAELEVVQLLRAARGAQYFRSTEGRFHACVAVNGREETLSLRSHTFREWLIGEHLKEGMTLPADQSIRRVIRA